jgi:hypothetical protein
MNGLSTHIFFPLRAFGVDRPPFSTESKAKSNDRSARGTDRSRYVNPGHRRPALSEVLPTGQDRRIIVGGDIRWQNLGQIGLYLDAVLVRNHAKMQADLTS